MECIYLILSINNKNNYDNVIGKLMETTKISNGSND